MTVTLGWILAASFVGGTLSAGLAAFSLLLRASWVPILVSFAIGALLGAAFLEVIPTPSSAATRTRPRPPSSAASSSSSCWRSCCSGGIATPRTAKCTTPTRGGREATTTGAAAFLIIVGDTMHNFVDGLLIAAAFLQSTQVGIIAAVAIVAHEIPQEVGDFLILLHSGYTRARALAMNLLSSLATVVGGLIGYFGLRAVADWEAALLGFVAASMIYVAVADLIPGLHRRPHLRDTASQALLIA
jgi:zinc and cadmium transporter